VVFVYHRSIPEGHDRVADVLVDACRGIARMILLMSVRYSLMYSRRCSGLSASDMLVKPRTSENSIVRSASLRPMVLLRVLGHLVHELGRHVLPEELGDWRFERVSTEYPVSHV